MRHPSDVLFPGEKPFPILPAVDHYAGSEKLMRKALAVQNELGPVWALVNNAGWDKPQPFLATDPAFWQKVIAINLNGNLNTHFAVAGRMAQRGGGRIINIASDAARVGTANEAVYSACTGGLISFTKSIARELARRDAGDGMAARRPWAVALAFGLIASGVR